MLKNHKVYGQISDLNALMQNLYKMDSIYFAPANKIMPTAFFKCWTWMKGESALLKHLKAGSFWSVESYDKISRRRIREALSDCWKGAGVQFSDEDIFKMMPTTVAV